MGVLKSLRYLDPLAWVLIVISGLALVFSVWVGIEIYRDATAETIEIKKSEWFCSKTSPSTRLQPMLVGKVTIMIPITEAECVAYVRR